MRIYITGITGTVAPYVKEELKKRGHDVFDKHFRVNSDNDLVDLKDYLNKIKPEMIYHLALGPMSVVELLLEYCNQHDADFVYISTASVFEDNQGGPYTVDTEVTVINDYGKYKFDCENIVRKVRPKSHIIRIGWQISEKMDKESNNMFHFIEENLINNEITVSDQFFPSTSFLPDTAEAIVNLVDNFEADLYLLNSNAGKSLYDIIRYLIEKYRMDITVKKDSSFRRNDIMLDDRVQIKKI